MNVFLFEEESGSPDIVGIGGTSENEQVGIGSLNTERN